MFVYNSSIWLRTMMVLWLYTRKLYDVDAPHVYKYKTNDICQLYIVIHCVHNFDMEIEYIWMLMYKTISKVPLSTHTRFTRYFVIVEAAAAAVAVAATLAADKWMKWNVKANFKCGMELCMCKYILYYACHNIIRAATSYTLHPPTLFAVAVYV